MPDTLVSLGGYTFSSWGVPEWVNGGGRQRLAIHQLIGGTRVVDAMGWVPDRLKFSGNLRGADASVSVRLLETLTRVGVPVTFSYWANRYQVIVSALSWKFKRYYEISYELTLEVLSDLTQDPWQFQPMTTDSLFGNDLTSLQSIPPAGVALGTAIASISVTQSQIGPLRNVSSAGIAPLLTAVTNAAIAAHADVATLDGAALLGAAGNVVSGGNAAQMAVALINRAVSFGQLSGAVLALALLGRMQVNLKAVTQ